MAHLFPRAADVSRKLLRCLFGSALLLASASVPAEVPSYRFGVIPQRSAVLSAQYWNPILKYVASKTGLELELRIAKTAPEHAAMVGRGEYDLIYSNHQFKPENDAQGYRVFARPLDGDMTGQIVVLAHSSLQSLADLEGKEVVFPSEVAFVGYTVPMDALARAGVKVKPLFASNQEGAMGQLRAGRAVAAGVNSQVMQDYAKREGLGYRALWSSESFRNIPLAAHPRVASKDLAAIQAAFVGMAGDPEGQRILQASTALIRQDPPLGFVVTSNRDYDNQRRVYRGALK